MTWLFFPIPVIIYLVTNIFISQSQHCQKHETVHSDFRFKYLSDAKNCQKLQITKISSLFSCSIGLLRRLHCYSSIMFFSSLSQTEEKSLKKKLGCFPRALCVYACKVIISGLSLSFIGRPVWCLKPLFLSTMITGLVLSLKLGRMYFFIAISGLVTWAILVLYYWIKNE